MKLTKSERDFFSSFSRTAVANLLGPVLAFKGIDLPEEGLEQVVDTLDLSELTQRIGEEFKKHADFKTIKKVDKLMRGEEFQTVVTASTLVNEAIQELLISIVAPLIPQEAQE